MSDTELAAVVALSDQRTRLILERDADGLAPLLSDDLDHTHSNGMVDTKASFLDNIRNGPIVYTAFDFSERAARLVGDTAILTARAAVELEFDGHPVALDLRYTSTWVKGGGSWLLEAIHASSVAG